MKKVIFLDVDGELTYSGYSNPDTFNIDYEKVALLKRIVDETGAIIILSSSWKCMHDKQTGEKRRGYRKLEEALAAYGLKIYEDLPDIKPEVQQVNTEPMTLEEIMNEPVDYTIGRAVEIVKWIQENQPTSFVILDDEDWHWEHFNLHKHWIQPSWHDENGGLHEEHVEKAIRILNEGGEPG